MANATQQLPDTARLKRQEKALREIARYTDWDFSKVDNAWKFCNLFICIAKEGLKHNE